MLLIRGENRPRISSLASSRPTGLLHHPQPNLPLRAVVGPLAETYSADRYST